MKTILHISKYYYPDLGGIETVAKSTVDGLKDYRNVVICFSTTGQDAVDEIDGIKIYRVKVNFSLMHQDVAFGYFSQLKKLLKEYNPDFIHVHCPNPFVYPLVKKVIAPNTRLVLHWHADIMSKGVVYNLIKPFETAILKRSDMIIATSPNYVHPSSPIYSFREKIAIVPNGIVVNDFEKKEGDDRIIDAIKSRYDHRPLVFFVGRHIAYKGIDLLIEAERFIKSDCRIIIAGMGPLTEELKRKVSSPRVIFIGRLDADELRCHAWASSVFAFPSDTKAEAFGVALAEAMYCKCVPVVFHLEGSGVNWVSIEGETGLEVPLGDVRAFAEAVDALLSNHELREKMAETSRQRVEAMFTDNHVVSQMNEAYSRVSE